MPKKKQRPQNLNIRVHRDATKLKKYWQYQADELDDNSDYQSFGRVRTQHENYLILMALKMILKLDIATENNKVIKAINWTKLEKTVATELHVCNKFVKKLRLQYFEDGDIYVNPTKKNEKETEDVEDVEDNDNDNDDGNQRKLTSNQLEAMIAEIDKRHGVGKGVTNQLMINYIMETFNIKISKTTCSNYFKFLGLSYKPIKAKRRNIGAYRMDMLRDFLIAFSEKYAEFLKDEETCPYAFVFTDESYVHRRLGLTNSYFGTKSKEFNRSASKGDRLIIMHAITCKGPLTEYDADNQPCERLFWTNDTPSPYPNVDGLHSCETIWKATIKTGDYHENMSSDMFMKWVTECLIPTFEHLNPKQKMCLIMDNAAYHHKRTIDTLSSKTKEHLVSMAADLGCTHINIPITERRHDWLIADNYCDNIMNYDGVTCDITFDERFVFTASRNNPFIPTVDELRRGLLIYITAVHPEHLVCEVEKALTDRGHCILWTPPYTPELQPIELFWAAGKNNVRFRNHSNTTNKEVVEYLREGWYGNDHLFEDDDGNDDNNPKPYDLIRKAPVNCRALMKTCIDLANTKYIPLCAGLGGVMGDLIVHSNHVRVTEGTPIDWMMNDLGVDKLQANNGDDNDDNDDDSDDGKLHAM